ncbi:MAG: exosortase/archaeosortase family protein [Verrucomicrobiales bacterium]
MSSKNSLLFTFAALALLFRDSLGWYFDRLNDGGGETLSLLPLALGGFFLCKRRKELRRRPLPALFLLTLAVLTRPFLPPLLQALLFLATSAFFLGFWWQAGLVLLFTLALPLQASLDFFFSYPLRLLTGHLSAFFLNTLGQEVSLQGVQLLSAGRLVEIAPACSGLGSLWCAGLFTALLATLYRLPWRALLLLGSLALPLVLTANALRATLLFFPEAGIVSLPHWTHPAAGLLLYAGFLFLLQTCTQRLISRKTLSASAPQFVPAHETKADFALLACALLGLLLTSFTGNSTSPELASSSPPVLTHYEGQPLTPLPLSASEKNFYHHFPGHIAIYKIGDQPDARLILRQVNRATRRLHPVAHCLRAEGYQLEALDTVAAEENPAWNRLLARRDGRSYLVEERIFCPESEESWSEVSAWFWHAFFHPREAPWQAIALIQALEKTDHP